MLELATRRAWDIDEIAELLGMSRGAVRTAIREAEIKLARAIESARGKEM